MIRDMPMKSGSVAEIALTLNETTKEKLRSVNIRSIDPVDLSELALTLHHEGYLAHESLLQLGFYQLDYTGLIDPLKISQGALESIRGVDDAKYALGMRFYETAIDAIVGIEQLSNYLNDRSVDVYV